jgi:hypothetical protein
METRLPSRLAEETKPARKEPRFLPKIAARLN